MKTRLISTIAMAACPALSVFASNGNEMESIISYSVSLVGFFFFFFLIKHYFEKNNPEIKAQWIIAHPLFLLYGWGWAFQAILDPRMQDLFARYSQSNPMAVVLLLLSSIAGLVVSVIAFYTIHRILKHKSKPFNSFPAIIRYCTVAFTVLFLGLCYHFNEIDKFSSAFGVSFGTNIGILIFLVVIAWVLFYRFNEYAVFIIHDDTSSANVNITQSPIGSTKQCPYCGETILAVAKKCRYCGEWLKEETQPKQKMPCPICGELVDEGTELCPHCNEKISLPPINLKDDSANLQTSDENVYEEGDNYRGLYIIVSVVFGIGVLLFILFGVVTYSEYAESVESVESQLDDTTYEYVDSVDYSYY